jgi:hypothetical protein
MTLSIKVLVVTLKINDSQHMTLFIGGHYAKCHVLIIVILNVVVLSVTGHTHVAYVLTLKDYTRVEIFVKDEHSSLLRQR